MRLPTCFSIYGHILGRRLYLVVFDMMCGVIFVGYHYSEAIVRKSLVSDFRFSPKWIASVSIYYIHIVLTQTFIPSIEQTVIVVLVLFTRRDKRLLVNLPFTNHLSFKCRSLQWRQVDITRLHRNILPKKFILQLKY